MRYLLSEKSRPVLRRLASERTLCAFDFDGTLAPIVEHPGDAALRPRTKELLTRLAALYPVIIISGRGRADVLERLDGVPVRHVIGGHGAEPETAGGEARERVREWRERVEASLDGMPGIWVEDKGVSLAVHYRQYPRKAEARQRIAEATGGLQGAHVFGGKEVVNIVEEDAPHKGTALAAERERLGCDWVLFAGDDDNDEEAFALEGNTVAVRVGKKNRSRARYYLRAQSEMDALLEALISERERLAV